MANLTSIDRLNVLYYGEMDLSVTEKKFRIVMADELQSVVSKYYDAVRAIAADKNASEKKRGLLLAAVVTSLRKAYLGFFDKFYERYVGSIFQGGEPYYGVNAWRNQHALEFAVWIIKTAQSEPNLAFSQSHSIAVTRTEVNTVGNLAALDAAYRSGLRFKEWETFGDGKVRPSHRAVNGVRIPIDEPFTVGGSKLMFPGDTSLGADAEEIVNCRCTLKFFEKGLTNGNGRGIMRVGSGGVSTISAEREQEYGVPYGKYAVNADMEYINSENFAKKFKNISENAAVNKTLLQCARNAIAHRNGTLYEDMYLINGNTGEILGKQLDSDYEQGIFYNESILSALDKAKAENIPLVAFHSHPEGYPPSADDINKAYENEYSLGVVVGHNGQVYTYSNKLGYINNPDIVQQDINFAYRQGYDVDRAYEDAYKSLGYEYNIVKE